MKSQTDASAISDRTNIPSEPRDIPTGRQINIMTNNQHASLADFIWKNADDLWGNFKHVDFGKIILPFTLLRRLECVLEPTRAQVVAANTIMSGIGIDIDVVLRHDRARQHCLPMRLRRHGADRRGQASLLAVGPVQTFDADVSATVRVHKTGRSRISQQFSRPRTC